MDVSYEIAMLDKPINTIYKYKVNRITKKPNGRRITEEMELCQSIEEAAAAIEKYKAKS